MKNPFTFEKGMEVLEQGGNTAKQQVKTIGQSTTSQLTGQQPSPQSAQNSHGQQLDSFKEQIVGVQDPKTTLSSVKTQLVGVNTASSQVSDVKGQLLGNQPQPTPTAESLMQAQVTQQAQDEKFKNDLYGVSDDPKQKAQIQQTLDPTNMAAKQQAEQQKAQSVKDQLERYFNPEIEQKMAQLRQQRVQENVEEKKEEEQQKMQELQVEEKKKDEDIALKRAMTKAEVKGGGAG